MPDPGSDPEEKRVTPADRRRPPSASSAWPKAESYPVAGTTIENAQAIAAHASPRTTKLYDRTSDAITLDEVERIRI